VPDLLHDGWYTADEIAALLGVDAAPMAYRFAPTNRSSG
jgi:hypothetical protein